jgi:Tol biopolymer transport system component
MGAALNPALSPDVRRVALFANAGISLLDTQNGALSRLSFNPGAHFVAIWSPDGKRMAISSSRSRGPYDLYEVPATGAGTETLLLRTPYNKAATDWSRDGDFLLYRSFDPRRAFDIWALPLEDLQPFPLIQTDADERNAQFSPDGRWIAYQSNESGRFEIWVQPFSTPTSPRSGRWQISTSGGAHVRWRHDGKELFYIAPDSRVHAAAISVTADGSAIEHAAPRPLFAVDGLDYYFSAQGTILAPYNALRDGRFLIAKVLLPARESPLTLVLGWKPP